MKNFLFGFCRYWAWILTVCILSFPLDLRAQTFESALETTGQLVVKIDGTLGGAPTIGSGIIFGRANDRVYIVTANHVVRRGEEEIQNLQVTLKTHLDEPLPGILLQDFDGKLDLAVLRVDLLSKRGIEACALDLNRRGKSDELKRGNGVFAVGHPNGVSWFLSSTPDPLTRIQEDFLIFESFRIGKGHAGGALLNPVGGLIGMIKADQPPFGQAVRLEAIIKSLEKWNYPISLTPLVSKEELIEMVRADDFQMLQTFLRTGESCREHNLARRYEGFPILNLAALYGSKESVQFLLSLGVDVNQKTNLGMTALYLAAGGGEGLRYQPDMVNMLVQAGADVHAKTHTGDTVLHEVARSNRSKIHEAANMLIQAGADVNAKNDSQETPFHIAARKTNFEMLKLFLQAGATINAKGRHGRSALFHLLRAKPSRRKSKMIKTFIRMGADVNIQGDDGWTVLHAAAGSGDVELVSTFIEAGAEINRRTNAGETALYLGASRSHRGHLEVVQLLLQAGAQVNVKTNTGDTVLLTVFKFANERTAELINVLLKAGADVNATRDTGETALHLAARSSQARVLDIVKMLLQAGADVNVRTREEETALHLAVVGGQQSGGAEKVKMLLEAGADVNAKRTGGETALHMAIEGFQTEVAKILIQAGADVTARLDSGETPLLLGASRGLRVGLGKILLEAGADPKAKTNTGETVLHFLAKTPSRKDLEIAEMFIKAGVNVNAKTNTGNTALHFAAESKRFSSDEMSKLLIQAGADVNILNDYDETPYHIAIRLKKPKLAMLFLAAGADPMTD